MSTPEEQPSLDDARARAAAKDISAALDEDQEPESDEPLGWQPIWKRPRKPKSKSKLGGDPFEDFPYRTIKLP